MIRAYGKAGFWHVKVKLEARISPTSTTSCSLDSDQRCVPSSSVSVFGLRTLVLRFENRAFWVCVQESVHAV